MFSVIIDRVFLNCLYIAASIFVCALYLNVPVYFAATDRLLYSYVLVLSSVVASLSFYLAIRSPRTLPHGLMSGASVFLVVLVLSLFSLVFISDEISYAALKVQIRSFFVLLSLIFFCLACFWSRRCVATLFGLFGFLAVVLNVVDFFDEGIFFEQLEGFGIRAAGFYINANKSAEAILLAMAVFVPSIHKRVRLIVSCMFLFGILLTLSRGGLLGWVFLYGVFVLYRVLPRTTAVAFIFFAPILSALIGAFFVAAGGYIDLGVVAERIDFLSGGDVGILEDSRIGLALRAMELFSQSPVYGNGSYSMLRDGSLQQAHNQYLAMLSDYGLAGIALYFALLRACWTVDIRGRCVVLFVFFWGFFSHNILDSYVFLVTFSYCLVLRVTQRYKARDNVECGGGVCVG